MEESECCGNGCNNCVLDKNEVPRDPTKVNNVVLNHYQWFKVTDIKQETDFVFIFEFQYDDFIPSDSENGLYVPPGSHLVMRLPQDMINAAVNSVFMKIDFSGYHKTKQKPEDKPSNDPETTLDYFSRSYTPYEYHSEELKFRILFRYEGGDMSQRIVRLKIGDRVEWKGFYGDGFRYERNMYTNIICISQGVAVSTMINIIKSILEDDLDETRIQFIACFRDPKQILLQEILREFQRFWNFKLTLCLPHFEHLCLENGTCNCKSRIRIFNEEFIFEKLSEGVIERLINPTSLSESTYHLISGSKDFTKSISVMLQSLGIRPGNIFAF